VERESRKFRKLKNKLLFPFEWLGILLGLCVIPLLSRRMLFRLCDILSRVMYVFDRRGKRRALENLRVIRGKQTNIATELLFDPDRARFDPTHREKAILIRSYRNMGRAAGYAFWTCVRARQRCAETGVMEERGRRFLAANRSAITVSGHLGCWEILSQLAILEGHRMMSVAKSIGTKGMTALLLKSRRSIGQEIIPVEGAAKTLLQGLRAGKSLGLLVDQTVSPKRGGIWVRFFGLPISVSPLPAFFAMKTKTPLVVAWARPLNDFRYLCEVLDEVPVSEYNGIWNLTQRCTRDLERVIRRHPSCLVLNYNFFSNCPTPDDLNELAKRESTLS